MRNKLLKSLFGVLVFSMVMPLPLLASAQADAVDPVYDVSTSVTAADIGLTEGQINGATTEKKTILQKIGTLIEIGNTTAKLTSIIVRIKNQLNQDEDVTLEVPTTGSVVQNSAGGASNLSDWIAGDQISFTANSTESGALQATNVKDKAISWFHSAKNGWITAIRPEQNQVDVMWNNTTYTLNTSSAKMVAGVKNPATLADFKIGDRVRARVVADTDGNPLTWNAQIMVVLRRGNDLFMRVTRWVVKGTITMIPEELGSPITIEVKIMPSDFFQANDVNNTLGAPGKIIKVDITPETKLFRRFLGKAYLKEFSEGDEINIIGRVDESSGHLVAKFIQNKSVQKLGKVYRLGKVDAVDLTANTINVSLIYTHLPERYWTIRVFPITKIIENDNTVTLADIQVGEKLRIIGGSADFTNKTVIAERIIVVKPILITPVAY